MAEDAGTRNDDEEWRFSVDEVGDDTGEVEEADTIDEDDSWAVTVGDDGEGPAVAFGESEETADQAADEGGNIAGTVTPEIPVESDTPELESAVFVAAGALLVLLVFASIVTPLTLRTMGLVTAAVVAVTAVVYAVFVRF